MATANLLLIEAIRKAAVKIETGEEYEWGHMGACNCGHLAQELTRYSKNEIHEYAMRKHGDWTEQSIDFCDTSKQPIDLLISEMMNSGLAIEDISYLEKLSDPKVIAALPAELKHPKHNRKEDVVLYMKTWASVLENELTPVANTNKVKNDSHGIILWKAELA